MVERKPSSIKPVLVLVCICVVISGLLAGVNAVTAPVIEARRQTELAATLGKLLPNATTFSELDVGIAGVKEAYKDDGGSGYAFVTVGNGYKGDVTVTTAIGPDGAILSISVDASGESPNIGDRVALPDYTGRFTGFSGTAANVDTLGGATASSKAVKQAVELAFRAYEEVKEG